MNGGNMPNNITNIITFNDLGSKELESLTEDILNSEGKFDFNDYVAMPDVIKESKSPNRDADNKDACIKATGHQDW